MPNPKEEQRRSAEFDPEREESAVNTANAAVSSKRLRTPGELAKNATGQKPPGKPRSGSDSNASRGTRGN